MFGVAWPQTPLATCASSAPSPCLPPHKFLATINHVDWLIRSCAGKCHDARPFARDALTNLICWTIDWMMVKDGGWMDEMCIFFSSRQTIQLQKIRQQVYQLFGRTVRLWFHHALRQKILHQRPEPQYNWTSPGGGKSDGMRSRKILDWLPVLHIMEKTYSKYRIFNVIHILVFHFRWGNRRLRPSVWQNAICS